MPIEWLVWSFWGALAALAVAGAGLFLLRRVLIRWAVGATLVRLLKEPYDENLWDLVTGIARMTPMFLMELELRCESPRALERPLGSVVRVASLRGVTFNPAQLARLPLPPTTAIDTTVTLGPRARRPLRLEMPILIGGMGYATAFSKPVAIALARAASRAGTAYNAGSGPVPDAVLTEAKLLVLQYAGGAWTRDPNVLAEADMIEIRFGHGARAALGRKIYANQIPREAWDVMGLTEGGQVIVDAPLPKAGSPAAIRRLVPELRRLIDGGPVGAKLVATHDLEWELDMLLEAGIDVISIDAGDGGTHGTPPVIADDFGLPLPHALKRAVDFLERTGARRTVSLVIGGGLRSPGEMIKALALGADAVSIGTMMMMALAHGQLSRVVPFEPVTQLLWARGVRARRFDVEQGARNGANFLQSCRSEMAEAARALGRRRLRDITRADLVARDMEAVTTLELPPTWQAPGG